MKTFSVFVPLIALAVAVVLAARVFQRPRASRAASALLTAVTGLGIALAGAGVVALWYFRRPQPPPHKEVLFEGVTYERDVRTAPRPIVAHVVRIDLRAPGLSFLVTPLEADGVLRGATVSQFLKRHGAQLAINGDFLLPWWSDGPADFYPHVGDPVDAVGLAVSNGVEYGWMVAPRTTLVFEESGTVSIVEIKDTNTPLPKARQALSGKTLIVDGGAATAEVGARPHRTLHPRVAAALDRTGQTLLLFVVDGRQPGYSEGASLEELAAIVIDHGGYRAMNLDGGGSSTLVVDDGEGGARYLNVPIHTRIPWRERPVANHLGVFARSLDGR